MIGKRHLLGAWGGIGFLTFFFIGFWPLAHFLPGHDPSAAAEVTAELYRSNATGIRLAMVLLLTGGACYLLFISTLGDVLRRIEGPVGYFSKLQMVGGVTGSIFLYVPAIFWGITAFRPERAPELTQLLNDASWLLLITAVPPFIMQTLPMAAIILMDRSEKPLFPRWFGYATIWGDLIYLPGMVAFFFKTGPFAWNGLFPYWLPFFGYGTWILVTSIFLMQIVKREAGRPDPAAT